MIWARLQRTVVVLGMLLASTVAITANDIGPASADPAPSFARVSAGAEHVCAVTAGGAGYCWGSDQFGQLGTGPAVNGNQLSPAPVVTPAGVTWAHIDPGREHTCGVSTAGAAFCWGSDELGRLGNGPALDADQQSPSPVVTPPGVTWKRVLAGSFGTCGLTTTGTAYCWGVGMSSYTGQSPVAVPGGPWASLTVDNGYACALTPAGAAHCWGSHPGSGPTSTPTLVPAPAGVTWATIDAGESSICAVSTAGAAYCWGRDEVFGLGNGPDIVGTQPAPSPVATPAGVVWKDIAAWPDGACATTTTGAGYCWGNFAGGLLGSPGSLSQHSPNPIATPAGVSWAGPVTAGRKVVCATSTGGTTFCWGWNDMGQVGNGGVGSHNAINSVTAPSPVGAAQSLSFAEISPKVAGTSFDPGATASSGLPVTYSTWGQCTVVGSVVTPGPTAGECHLTAQQVGGGGWGPTEPSLRIFQVLPPPPSFSVSDASVVEGDTAFHNRSLAFTVTLSQPLSGPATVKYATADGTATAGSDYSARALTTLTFKAGEMGKVVTVPVSEDKVGEADETVLLDLSAPSAGILLGDAQGVGTITNDDVIPVVPSISVADLSQLEGTRLFGTTSFVFTVQLSAPAPGTVKVTYQTADGTAVQPSDYAKRAPTSLSFSKGQSSKTVTVKVKGDRVDEPNEQMFLLLSNPVGATLADGTAIATIVDDD